MTARHTVRRVLVTISRAALIFIYASALAWLILNR